MCIHTKQTVHTKTHTCVLSRTHTCTQFQKRGGLQTTFALVFLPSWCCSCCKSFLDFLKRVDRVWVVAFYLLYTYIERERERDGHWIACGEGEKSSQHVVEMLHLCRSSLLVLYSCQVDANRAWKACSISCTRTHPDRWDIGRVCECMHLICMQSMITARVRREERGKGERKRQWQCSWWALEGDFPFCEAI